jgi:hypothetical protein
MKKNFLYIKFRDGLGRPVPSYLQRRMRTREQLLKHTDVLRGWEKMFTETMDRQPRDCEGIDREAVLVAIDAAINIIQEGAPFARCECVTGEKVKVENCDRCHGKRWLTQAQYMERLE